MNFRKAITALALVFSVFAAVADGQQDSNKWWLARFRKQLKSGLSHLLSAQRLIFRSVQLRRENRFPFRTTA